MNNVQILRTIHLYGKLKDYCGGLDKVELVGDNLRIIVSGLVSRFGPKIKQFIKDNNWHVYVGKTDNEKELDNNRSLSNEEVDFKLGNERDVHFMPHIEGASGRTGQIILGVILVVVGVILLYTPFAAFGPSLISAGIGIIIGALLAPSAQKQQEKPEERASFVFNGPVNTMGQGGPVPLVYGRFRTGSAVVSAGINAEQLMTYTSPPDTNPLPDSTVWTP